MCRHDNDSCISDAESDDSCVSDNENEDEYEKRDPHILKCLAKENETETNDKTKMNLPPPPLKIKFIESFVSNTGNESQSDGEESDNSDKDDEGKF